MAVPNRVNDEVMVDSLLLIGTIVHSPADLTNTGHYFDACYAANFIGQNGLNIGKAKTKGRECTLVDHF